MAQRLEAQHGTVVALEREKFGYFMDPTIARLGDGRLVAVASGFRYWHVCPFGKTTLFYSHDQGKTWTAPRVINDTVLDDRDTGIISLGGQKLLVSWFRSDTRYYTTHFEEFIAKQAPHWLHVVEPNLKNMTDENVAKYLGSWVMRSDDGGETWDTPTLAPVNCPHGPICLKNGDVLYFGKEFNQNMEDLANGVGPISAYKSTDGGKTWVKQGTVPFLPGTGDVHVHEPHVVELPSGKLVGMIRIENGDFDNEDTLGKIGLTSFSMTVTESTDGGVTWSMPRPLGFHGAPPHLIYHSSGVIICAYSFRKEPFGQRIALSYDEGKTWQHDFILRDDGPDWDLGYDASIELEDGSILTIYYQKAAAFDEKCCILSSRWRLP